jgi:hypothetical protein
MEGCYFLRRLLIKGLGQTIKILGHDCPFPGRDTKLYMTHTTIIHFVADIMGNRIIKENNYTFNLVFVTHLSANVFFTIFHSLSNTPGHSYNTDIKQLR